MNISWKYNEDVNIILTDGYYLLVDHWNELANNKDKIFLNPDKDKYKQLQDSKILTNVCVFDDGKIIGYSVILSMPNLHYKDDVFSYVDVIFLDKEYRNSSIGISLIKRTEEICNRLGSSIISFHTKVASPAIEKVLLKLGYSHMENIYGKVLKG